MPLDGDALNKDDTEDDGSEDRDTTASPQDIEKMLADYALASTEGVFGPDGKVRIAAGRGTGLRFVATYFPEAKSDLRIATSYFTLAGYDLGRRFVSQDTKLQVLVGQAQGKETKKAVVGEMITVLREIMRELGTTLSPLANAVEELIGRIRAGKFIFRSASEMLIDVQGGWRRFHCKFYIADDVVVWSGSANFTRNGLCRFGNDEQLTASRNADEIEYFRLYYDELLKSSEDLLADLLFTLEQWLKMHIPFNAYLKVLLCTYGKEDYLVEYPAKEPTYFQEGVITRAVEQARQYDGTLLLVATGLGKTVIGAEIARRLLDDFRGGTIRRLIVIAPRTTKKGWHDELTGRGCAPDHFFDNSTLFVAAQEDETRQASLLEQCILQCTASTVFLIDEAHRYRNLILKTAQTNIKNRRLTAEQRKSNNVARRMEQIAEQGAKVILLTATPFGTQRQNINSLLYMLPPKSPSVTKVIPKDLFDQTSIEGNTHPATVHWSITHVNKTAQNSVVTVLGMLHVLQMAHERGDCELDGRLFLTYKDGSKKYLPAQIRFHRIEYGLYLQEVMEQAVDAKVFDGEITAYLRWSEEKSDAESVGTNSWLNNTLRAWLSSPQELRRVLQICHDTPDPLPGSKLGSEISPPLDLFQPEQEPIKAGPNAVYCRVKFFHKQAIRQSKIEPILALVDASEDMKFDTLFGLIEKHRIRKEKVIIFVKRHATAVYLEEKIGSKVGRVCCTVQRSKDGQEYKLKTPAMRRKLVRGFAPDANTPEGGKRPLEREQKDILICTDADGIGQNMQDASVVINYDLPLTADELFQRAGRVLRPTLGRDREVDLYTFVPDVNAPRSDAAVAVKDMVKNLFDRQNQANDVIDCGRILPAKEDLNPVVMSLACAEDLGNIPAPFKSLEDRLPSTANSMARHISNWEKYKDQALQLGENNVMSAKSAKIRQNSVCVFIKCRRGTDHVLFNLKKNCIEPSTLQKVLDLLECPPETKRDTISLGQIEVAAIKAFEAWLALQSEAERRFPCERVCAVYLRPETFQEPEDAVGQMLKE